jgi:hypothetical protein
MRTCLRILPRRASTSAFFAYLIGNFNFPSPRSSSTPSRGFGLKAASSTLRRTSSCSPRGSHIECVTSRLPTGDQEEVGPEFFRTCGFGLRPPEEQPHRQQHKEEEPTAQQACKRQQPEQRVERLATVSAVPDTAQCIRDACASPSIHDDAPKQSTGADP